MTARPWRKLRGKPTMRQCLRCHRRFRSLHRFHRLCRICRKEIKDMPEDHKIGE